MNQKKNDTSHSAASHSELGAEIRVACQRDIGVLHGSFLCQSVSVLEPRRPLCVTETTTVGAVVAELQRAKIGCVLVVNEAGQLTGIFSERDLVLKGMDNYPQKALLPVSDLMTRDPVAELPDTTVAFALNLMSLGGFRHLPIVDSDRLPIGIVSVKDVIDFIVQSFMADLEKIAPTDNS